MFWLKGRWQLFWRALPWGCSVFWVLWVRLNEINLWHLNLGLVLRYGRSALRLSDFLLFLSLTLQLIIHHRALQPRGRVLFTHRRRLESTAEQAGGWVAQRWCFACKEHSALISTEPLKCFHALRNRDILTLDVIFQIWMLLNAA